MEAISNICPCCKCEKRSFEMNKELCSECEKKHEEIQKDYYENLKKRYLKESLSNKE